MNHLFPGKLKVKLWIRETVVDKMKIKQTFSPDKKILKKVKIRAKKYKITMNSPFLIQNKIVKTSNDLSG